MRRVNEKVEERNVRLQEAQSRLQRQERVLEVVTVTSKYLRYFS